MERFIAEDDRRIHRMREMIHELEQYVRDTTAIPTLLEENERMLVRHGAEQTVAANSLPKLRLLLEQFPEIGWLPGNGS